MRKQVLLLVGVLSITGALLWSSRSATVRDETPSSAVISAPEWELADVDGNAVSSRQFAGKVVILDFWATWCPPCRAEIPGFVELQRTYGDKGLVIVGVSLDTTGVARVKEFMMRFKMNYPVVMGDDTISEAFGGITGLPTTFIIDRKGNIVAKHVGFADKETFEREFKPLL